MTKIKRNIGSNRGRGRVWIEKKPLSENGWLKGVRYKRISVFADSRGQGFDLLRDKAGPLKVAGGPGRPVIDICGAFVDTVLDGFDTVEISISSKKISIRGKAFND